MEGQPLVILILLPLKKPVRAPPVVDLVPLRYACSACSYGTEDHPGAAFSGRPEDAWRGAPAPRATLRVYSLDFFRKIVLKADTGLGEAYMERVGGAFVLFVQSCCGAWN